jgi:hypothetical protein
LEKPDRLIAAQASASPLALSGGRLFRTIVGTHVCPI